MSSHKTQRLSECKNNKNMQTHLPSEILYYIYIDIFSKNRVFHSLSSIAHTVHLMFAIFFAVPWRIPVSQPLRFEIFVIIFLKYFRFCQKGIES